ncbi:MAG TPA: hypothetical protein VMZ51_02545 [Acidimicrobiales bacterium]|nr:hypothetical protein [Acidimicrobiales bacterium]
MTRFRTLAVAALVLLLSIGTAGPSLAKAGEERGGTSSSQEVRAQKAGAEARAAAKARRAEAQARRKARFVAVGIVSAVSGDSISLVVKGGQPRELRRTTRTILVSGADIRRNGKVAVVSDIEVGDHAMVKGVRAADTFTAKKVRAHSREEKPVTPASTPTSNP